MKYVPILFSTPMVKAILDGSKTQTRRIIKSPNKLISYEGVLENRKYFKFWSKEMQGKHLWQTRSGEFLSRPKAQVGDVFWVRETHAIETYFNGLMENQLIKYKADFGPEPVAWNWKPSIFMPKEACRLFLKVTNVRVERLHDISEEDAKAEGVKTAACETTKNCHACDKLCQESGTYWDYMNPSGECGFPSETAKESFFTLWESINGKESLDSNPWVWAYDFQQIEKPENFI